MEIKENVPLAPLTTFKIGGNARWYVEVQSEEDIKEALRWANDRKVRVVVFSGGSNILVPDGGLDALAVRFVEGTHVFSENVLRAEAGCDLLSLIRAAGARGWGAWEKLAGIPGSIGGAVRGNAGAFGAEIKDVVTTVHTVNARTLEARTFTMQNMSFSYRDSTFKRDPSLIITGAAVELAPVNPAESARLIEETIAERERRHLQNVQAAGSFFMNPVAPLSVVELFEQEKGVSSREGRVPAGWLIEKAGMKGAKVGDAIASLQHPNYLVNEGRATAHDVLNLAQMIKLEVYNQFQVELHEEAAIF